MTTNEQEQIHKEKVELGKFYAGMILCILVGVIIAVVIGHGVEAIALVLLAHLLRKFAKDDGLV